MIKKLITVSTLLLIIASCEDEGINSRDSFVPVIESVRLSERWNINATEALIVEIRVNDPQGFSDLRTVLLEVINSGGSTVFSDSLYDDGGLNGSTDIVAGDGVFRNRFLPTDISSEQGTFSFDFKVEDRSGNSAGLFQRDVVFAFNSAPQVLSAESPAVLESASQPLTITAKAVDSDGLADIKHVYMDLLLAGQSVISNPVELFDDGGSNNSGDLFAADSIFSLQIDSTFGAARQGDYILRFYAVDQSASQSSAVDKSIKIENEAGHIISSDMPDEVTRPAEIPIRVRVSDPQGLADIQRVYFELQASDGSFVKDNQGNNLKLSLFDDGDQNLHGDDVAGDGVFSVILSVDETNAAETYTFYFYTLDKVDNLSNSAQDTLVIN